VSYRVIVCGSRRWTDYDRIERRLNQLVTDLNLKFPDPVIVHGKCSRGADKLTQKAADLSGMVTEPHPAEWEKYGKRAGFVRNEEMAELGANLCLAFWDGKSTGTHDMITRAHNHGIPVEIVAGWETDLVCVLCGAPWLSFSNRCIQPACKGFCTWGETMGGPPSSWDVHPDGSWTPKPVPKDLV